MGEQFGSALLEAAGKLAATGGPNCIGVAKQEVALPLKPYASRAQQRTRLAELEQTLSELAQTPAQVSRDIRERWAIYQECAFLRYQLKWGDLETRQADLAQERVPVVLQAIQLGGVLLLTSPAEVFAETGIQLSTWAQEQGWQDSIVSSCTNGYINYIPPRAEAERGGFEPSCTMLAPGACERMVASLKDLPRPAPA